MICLPYNCFGYKKEEYKNDIHEENTKKDHIIKIFNEIKTLSKLEIEFLLTKIYEEYLDFEIFIKKKSLEHTINS